MKVYDSIFDGHAALVLERSRRVHEEIAEGLTKEGAIPLAVGAFQMRNQCGGETGKRQNLERMLSTIRMAAAQGVQMLAFPEMCLPGYFTPVSGTAEEAVAANHALADIVGESPYVEALKAAAQDARMVLAFGFAEKADGVVYNAIGVIDANGEWLGTRRKAPLYPWPFELDSFAEPGPEHRSVVFRTKYATVGVSNCFDGEFPESIRRMRLEGAEILLWCNAACGDSHFGTSHRIHHSQAHAQANNMWVVCCNCVAENASGTSLIASPHAEPLVILPPDEEALAIATIDLAVVTSWEPWKSRVDGSGYKEKP
ncbi:MAG TPA: carbon-nitrogen hydrolase family protein [Candidatus Latescibacteria bacterium]|nr:carbon-nitrogen hydrolase family protein [Candidatus Latescibacterota bacterium]HPK74575.1 carbon-nitrogen hydrolase family protein [Candidatus Latescibacterota bacterium]